MINELVPTLSQDDAPRVVRVSEKEEGEVVVRVFCGVYSVSFTSQKKYTLVGDPLGAIEADDSQGRLLPYLRIFNNFYPELALGEYLQRMEQYFSWAEKFMSLFSEPIVISVGGSVEVSFKCLAEEGVGVVLVFSGQADGSLDYVTAIRETGEMEVAGERVLLSRAGNSRLLPYNRDCWLPRGAAAALLLRANECVQAEDLLASDRSLVAQARGSIAFLEVLPPQ